MSSNKSFSTETSERYSRALFEVATEANEIDKVETDIKNFQILFNSSFEVKKRLFEYLLDNFIDIKNYYYKNCSEEKIYNKTTNYCLKSKEISENILMLPVHEKIEISDQKIIIKYILSFFNQKIKN